MPVTSQHVTGFVVGLGVAAAGFYFYKTNQKRVDAWLESQGVHLPGTTASDYSSMTLEELIREKEKLEDLIAEREFAAEQKQIEKPRRKGRQVARTKQAAKRARAQTQQPQATTA